MVPLCLSLSYGRFLFVILHWRCSVIGSSTITLKPRCCFTHPKAYPLSWYGKRLSFACRGCSLRMKPFPRSCSLSCGPAWYPLSRRSMIFCWLWSFNGLSMVHTNFHHVLAAKPHRMRSSRYKTPLVITFSCSKWKFSVFRWSVFSNLNND